MVKTNTKANGPAVITNARKLHNSIYKRGKLTPLHSLISIDVATSLSSRRNSTAS